MPFTPALPVAGLRRLPRSDDAVLSAVARTWLRQLPAGRRPRQLSERFPRLVNRIAWCWQDAALVDAVFDDLLTDRRGCRQGFPAAVVLELRRLRDHRLALAAPTGEGTWTASHG